MASSHRTQRVGDLIQQELANLFLTQSHDPRFQDVTITGLEVSKDLAHAKVFVTLHEEKNIKETIKALNHAGGYFRNLLAKNLNLRITPRLFFVYDESLAHGWRISSLLNDTPDPDEKL